jgi:hypothetical protein
MENIKRCSIWICAMMVKGAEFPIPTWLSSCTN